MKPSNNQSFSVNLDASSPKSWQDSVKAVKEEMWRCKVRAFSQRHITRQKQRVHGIAHTVHSLTMILQCRTHARAYRSPARSAFSTAASNDEGDGGEGSDSSDPPARPYFPLVIFSKSQSNSSHLAVIFPRRMLLCLSEGGQAA